MISVGFHKQWQQPWKGCSSSLQALTAALAAPGTQWQLPLQAVAA